MEVEQFSEPDFEDSMMDDDMRSFCDVDDFEKKFNKKSIPTSK